MPKSILLTGSTGFVGTNLVKSLTLKSDYIVKSAVRHAVNKDDGQGPRMLLTHCLSDFRNKILRNRLN